MRTCLVRQKAEAERKPGFDATDVKTVVAAAALDKKKMSSQQEKDLEKALSDMTKAYFESFISYNVVPFRVRNLDRLFQEDDDIKKAGVTKRSDMREIEKGSRSRVS